MVASGKRQVASIFGKTQLATAFLHRAIPILPLAVLRIAFGLIMLLSTIRFAAYGWIDEFYVKPAFHFTYWGFSWIRPLPMEGITAVFVLIGLASLFVMLGLFYRVSIISFFLLFSYVELIDKTYYLNHYYFISLFSFLLIWLPLHKNYSLDAQIRPRIKTDWVPAWTVWFVRIQIGVVYFFAGIAKLNNDWMLHALPLRIWLPAKATFPLIGSLFDQLWFAYAMSWGGALFDITIPFFLAYRKTRPFAYLAVIIFHGFTGALFNIGMFPLIMIACTLVFFSAEELELFIHRLRRLCRFFSSEPAPLRITHHASRKPNFIPHPSSLILLTIFLLFQLLFPLRHWLYPGDDKWTDEGFRQSWKVMLVEKTGHVTFYVTDPTNGRMRTIYPSEYLTLAQEKQMSFQPDMILEFAHFLAEEFGGDVEVRAEAWVSLNGRSSRLLIDPAVDLAAEHNTLRPKTWIILP